jgi:hypothetical protein
VPFNPGRLFAGSECSLRLAPLRSSATRAAASQSRGLYWISCRQTPTARLKRLYDERDRLIEEIEKSIAVDEGYDLTDRLQRGQAAVAADRAIERWEGRELEDQAPVPATPIEALLQKLYRHSDALRAMEEEMTA